MKNNKIKSYLEWKNSILKMAILMPLSICLLVYLVANLEYGVSLTMSLVLTIVIVGFSVLGSYGSISKREYETYKKNKQDEKND